MSTPKPKRRLLRERASSYRKPIQWQVDSDYLDKLSPEDREWMIRFQESEYGGNGHLMHRSKKEQRRLWVNQKKQQLDAMTGAQYSATGVPDGNQPSPEDALIETIDRQPAALLRALDGARAKQEERRAADLKEKRRRLKRRRSTTTPPTQTQD